MIGAHEAVLDYSGLFSITSHGDDIQDFDIRWDQDFLSTSEVPNDKILESLCKSCEHERESDQLKTVLVMYEQEINQDHKKPSYQKIEGHGKDTHRSNDQDTKLSSQKMKEMQEEYW